MSGRGAAGHHGIPLRPPLPYPPAWCRGIGELGEGKISILNRQLIVLSVICVFYTDHAGLEIPVDLCIASPFSQQIAIGNAGPILALDSMGPNPTFHCHFLNIGPSYKQ